MFWSCPRPILRDASFVVTRTLGVRGATERDGGGSAALGGAAPGWAVRAAPMACSFSGEDGRALISFARFKGTTVRHAWALSDEEMKSAAPQCWETSDEYRRAEERAAAGARCLAAGGYGDGDEDDSFASCDDDDDESDRESDRDGDSDGAEAAAVHNASDHPKAKAKTNADAMPSISFVCPEIAIDLNAAMSIDLSRPRRVVGDRVDKLLARVTLQSVAFTNARDGELASALSFGRIAIRDPEGAIVLASAESGTWVPGRAGHAADLTASWGGAVPTSCAFPLAGSAARSGADLSGIGARAAGVPLHETFIRLDVPNPVVAHVDHVILRRFLGGIVFSALFREDEWLRAFAYAAAPAVTSAGGEGGGGAAAGGAASGGAGAAPPGPGLEKRSRATNGFPRLEALQRGTRAAKRLRFAICLDAININMSTRPGTFAERAAFQSGALRLSKLICKFGFTTGGEMGRLLSDYYDLVLSAPHLVLWGDNSGAASGAAAAAAAEGGRAKEEAALLFLATPPSTVVRLAGSHTTGSHVYVARRRRLRRASSSRRHAFLMFFVVLCRRARFRRVRGCAPCASNSPVAIAPPSIAGMRCPPFGRGSPGSA